MLSDLEEEIVEKKVDLVSIEVFSKFVLGLGRSTSVECLVGVVDLISFRPTAAENMSGYR